MRKHVWLLVLTVLALLALIAFLPAAADQPASPGGQSSGPTTGSDAQGVKPDSSWADKAPLGHPAGPFQGLLPDTWITAAPLPAPARYRQASAADNAGRVFHFGGGTSTGAFLNEVQIYDVASNSWSAGAPMPNAGQNMMAVYNPITNKFYLPGGYNGAHNTWCQVYDPVANSWSTCAPLPAARSPMAAFFPLGAQGRIYIFGGNPGPTNEVRYLDVATNTWSAPQAPMPTARTYGSALTVGNYIYVIGGVVASPLNTCERYDPNTNTWATCPGMLTGRMNPHATWYNVGGVDYIYAFAGGGAGGDIWTAYNTVERYDVSAFPGGSWQNVADPVPDAPVAAGYACANDQVWLAGGTSGGSYFQTNRGYSEAGGSCGSLGPTPTPTPTPTGTWYTPTPTITPTPTNTPMGRCETIPPDPFGYQCEDWVTRTWITATQNTGLTQDDQVVPIPIGFTFSFYGQNFTTANVSSNGNLQFTTSSTSFSNVCPLPSGTLGLAILPFWDDLYLPAGGAVYYDTVGTAPNRIFVVEFRDVPHFGPSPSGGTFEVQIEESTGDIWLLYQDVDFGDPLYNNGASASVGIQNGPGGYALQYSCNQAVLAAGRVVHIFRQVATPTPGPSPTPTNTPPPTPTQAGILYDQYNNASTTGASSQNFEPSLDPYDDELADDFVVPAGPNLWFISGVDVDGVYFNGPGPADSVNVRFYANSGSNLPGTLLAERLNQPYTGTGGDFSITFTQTVVLGPGTYWVSVQANQNFTPNGQWGWIDRTVQSNSPAAWRNPGGGFGVCPDWGYRGSVCGIDPANPDQVFRIRGTSGPPTSVELAEFGGQAAAERSLVWMIPLAALGLLLSWALLRHRRRLTT